MSDEKKPETMRVELNAVQAIETERYRRARLRILEALEQLDGEVATFTERITGTDGVSWTLSMDGDKVFLVEMPPDE